MSEAVVTNTEALNPLAQAAECEFVAEPVADPKQLFAEHVAYVRAHGDALEPVEPWYKLREMRYLNIVGSNVVFGEMLTFAPTHASMSPLAGAAGSFLWMYNQVHQKKVATRQIRDRTAAEAQQALGEQYELYRVPNHATKKPQIILRWSGKPAIAEAPDDSEKKQSRATADSVRLIAELATEHDVSIILFDPALLPKVHAKRLATAEISISDWLRRTRGLDLRVTTDKKTVDMKALAFTPEQLRALARKLEQPSTDTAELTQVIDVLRAQAPNHPIIKQFERYKDFPDQLVANVTKSAQRSLERQLADVTAVKPTKHEAIAAAETEARTRVLRHKVHMDSSITGTTVAWQGTGAHYHHSFGESELLNAAGMSAETVASILERPESYARKQIILAAECAVYLNGMYPVPRRTEPIEDLKPATSENHLQQTIAESLLSLNRCDLVTQEVDGETEAVIQLDTNTHAHKRMLTRLSLAVVALTGVLELQHASSQEQQSLQAASETSYARQLGIRVDSLTKSEKQQADAAALHGHLFLEGYEASRHVADSGLSALDRLLHMQTPPKPVEETSQVIDASHPSSIDTGAVTIGNVTNTPDDTHAEWQITPYGDMSGAGYWATDTKDLLAGNSWIGGDQAIVKSGREPAMPEGRYFKMLEVSRQITVTDYDKRDNGKGKPANFYIHIPVLQGTRPVAINIDNQQVRYSKQGDGTYLVEPTEGGQAVAGKLTYWLAPDPSQKVQAVSPNELYGDTNNNNRLQSERRWNQVLGRPLNEAVSARDVSVAKQEAAYMQEHFSYSFTPLSPKAERTLQGDSTAYSTFVDEVLSTKLANCNVASTLVAIANPAVVPAVGYFNDGNNELQASEAHMWLVDSQGERIDPTPPVRAEAIPKPVESNTTSILDTRNVAEGLGLLLVIGAGFAATRRGKRWSAHKRLGQLSATSLQRAEQTAKMAAFAPRFDSRKLLEAPTKNHTEALEGLKDPHLHHGHIRHSLRLARHNAQTHADKVALRKAARALRLIKQAGLAHELLDPADATGVLR